MQIACFVGARPNFMKMAPLLRALEAHSQVDVTLVHTGQHYDSSLSDVFFEDLGMRRPDVSLEVGSGSHGQQTARVLERTEEFLLGRVGDATIDRVVVVGDVNSTMAVSLAAVKLGVSVAHVEAGLRSFDRGMPEEINRIVTDSIADLLLVSEPAGLENLRREGHVEDQIHLVGNVMIDTLLHLLPSARNRDTLARFSLVPQGYGVVTLHRPSNVDDPQTLADLLQALVDISQDLPLVFPIHPRTKKQIERYDLSDVLNNARGILELPPLGYLDFLSLTSQAKVIVTDSGGLQEETTALGIPCLTMRGTTERPVTVQQGTSTLIGSDVGQLRVQMAAVLEGTYKTGSCPELWDGQAAERIAAVLVG
jgi:UDP-N-acetylglucosamine 2-epimerase (non-hydrolysing)